MRIAPWLPRAAAAGPDHPAIVTPEAQLTYSELDAAAEAGARALAGRGIGPGDRVALTLPPGLHFAVAFHACLRLGAVAVAIDSRLTAPERAPLVAGAVLVDEPLDGHGPANTVLRAGHSPGDVAAVVHTSGTGATPRPVELTYSNWLWSALGSAVALGLERDERWLCALPLAHVGGLSILVRSAIYATTVVLHDRFDAQAVAGALGDADGPTMVSLVPTTLARVLDTGLERPPALRCALVGGAHAPPALLERARDAGVAVAVSYGLTEACSQVTTTRPGDPGADAGPPLFCTRVRTAPDGEVLVAGPTVARGAAGDDGWLRTGDVGSLDDHGRLTVTGRRDDLIVTGGENVSPGEVEAVLEEHAAVAEAAVVGREDAEWGRAVTAVVVLAPGMRVDPGELRAHCASRLARFKVPKRIDVAESLPRTLSGKLRRTQLR